jgi:hypothetical protein
VKDELTKLNDGTYALDITEILVDENGRIIYFDYKDLKRSKTADEIKEERKWSAPGVVKATDPQVANAAHYEEVSKSSQQAIYDKVCRLMVAAPGFIPGTSGGKKVVSTYIEPDFWNHFKIKDHKIYDMDKNKEYKEL